MKTLVAQMLTASGSTKAMKKPTGAKRAGPSPTARPKLMKNVTSADKRQPLKVVYISNPMRVEATAAEFRALVQELTGQDAADWPISSPSPSPSPSSSSSPKEYGGSYQNHVPRVVPENVSSDDVVVPDMCRVGDCDSGVKLSRFGSDLGCFGPFDGFDLADQDDRTVVMDNELDMSFICGFLQQ